MRRHFVPAAHPFPVGVGKAPDVWNPLRCAGPEDVEENARLLFTADLAYIRTGLRHQACDGILGAGEQARCLRSKASSCLQMVLSHKHGGSEEGPLSPMPTLPAARLIRRNVLANVVKDDRISHCVLALFNARDARLSAGGKTRRKDIVSRRPDR